jgi:hypothetical protein
VSAAIFPGMAVKAAVVCEAATSAASAPVAQDAASSTEIRKIRRHDRLGELLHDYQHAG